MAQRYEGAGNNRFLRERSPPRASNNSFHPNRSGQVDQRSKESVTGLDAPRGPRALTESHRGFGPLPPKGRGFSSRGDFRPEYREREPFRRDSSPPGRRRSPNSERFPAFDFRDHRDAQRDGDFGRGRKGFRDSAPTRFGIDGRGAQSYHPGRDDLGRGRGRFDFGPRGRGRGGFYDDRTLFRARSRSPPRSHRWERSPSRDGRTLPSERFDENKFERRDGDRLYDRDDRPRDENRFRGDRYPFDSSPTTPQSYRPAASQPLSAGRIPHDDRESSSLRRIPSAPDVATGRDQRYDSFRLESSVKRDTKPTENYASRGSSPPRAPEVPAFGSSTTKWNQWVAPEPKQTIAPPQSPQTTAPPPPPPMSEQQKSPVLQKPSNSSLFEAKLASGSPQSEPQQLAPKAPKAQRREVSPTNTDQSDGRHHIKQESPKLSLARSFDPPINAPTGPAPKGPSISQQSLDPLLRSPPVAPRSILSGPKTAMSPLNARQAPTSPGFHPPAGPRGNPLTASPNSAPVPTAPKADRAASFGAKPPIGPAGPTNWQWNRLDPQPMNSRSGMIPSKRDINGERKDQVEPKPDCRIGSEDPGVTQAHDGISHDVEMSEAPQLNGHYHEVSRVSEGPSEKPDDEHAAVESASEEDGIIDEDDTAKRENMFQQDRRRLQAKLIDLSTPEMRGILPMRCLNFLTRLSLEDPSQFFDPPRSRKPTTQRNVSQQDSINTRVEDLGAEYELAQQNRDIQQTPQPPRVIPQIRLPPPKPPVNLSPSPIGSPELQSLPFLKELPLTPLSDLDVVKDSLIRQDTLQDMLRSELDRRQIYEAKDEEELRAEFDKHYRQWRRHIKSLDSEKSREDSTRHETVEASIPTSAIEGPPPLLTESRRRGMHGTDYEIEQVMEMSRRIHEQQSQEKKDRDAASAKPNWDLEAQVPELVSSENLMISQFSDTSCLREVANMVSVWEISPPEDDFTQEEHDIMIENFSNFPKKFGKIADGLEGRNFKDCINHYYRTKWNGQYKNLGNRRRKPKSTRTKSGKPRANALISNLEDAKPDLYNDDDAAAPLSAYTESGRPKRAAAPTFKDKEQGDQANLATPAKKAAKGDAPAERTVEKSVKKPRGPPKEPRVKKPRNQPPGRRESRSPEKTDLDLGNADRNGLLPGDSEASLLAVSGQNPPHLLQRPNNTPSFAVEPPSSRPPLLPEAGKIQTVRSGHTTGTSSYWSVQEVDLFPQLLGKFGTNWTSIAQEMGTKSHTMVKNYFQRQKNNLDKGPTLEKIATEADARKATGEQPEEPTPQISVKRSKDTNVPTHARPLAPTPENGVYDLSKDEEKPSKSVAKPSVAKESIQKSLEQSEAPPVARPYHESLTHKNQQFWPPPSWAADPVASVQKPNPRLPTVIGEPNTTMPTASSFKYESGAVADMKFGSISEPHPSLIRQPYLTNKSNTEDIIIQRSQQRTIPGSTPNENQNTYGPIQPAQYAIHRPQIIERNHSEDMQRPMTEASGPSPHPPRSFRHPIEPSRSQSSPQFDPTRVVTPTTNPLDREDIRPQARPNMEKPAPPPPTSKPEPRKSNLMSILNNDEPEEPRPRPNPPPQPVQTPTPTQYGPPPSVFPPRPSSNMERREYPREHSRNTSITYQPAFLQPSHHPSRSSMDAPIKDTKLGPGMFHLNFTPTMVDDRVQEHGPPPSDHRASLHRLEARYNPSPPPPSQMHREPSSGSRTNSPFHQRSALPQQSTMRYESPPPPRFSNLSGPSMSHARDSSISHLNPSSRHPPPSVLQPQHIPRQPSAPSLVSQPVSIMQPLFTSRPDRGPPQLLGRANDIPPYPSSQREVESLFLRRVGDANPAAHAHNAGEAPYDNQEKQRVWGMAPPPREDDRDERRATDWTRGLQREPRYAPAETPRPPLQQSQPPTQYAPYNPATDKRRDEAMRYDH